MIRSFKDRHRANIPATVPVHDNDGDVALVTFPYTSFFHENVKLVVARDDEEGSAHNRSLGGTMRLKFSKENDGAAPRL